MTDRQPTPGVNESIVEKIATPESTTALSGEPWRSALQQAADLAEARAEELLDRWTSDLGATIETKAAGAASYIIAGLHGDILALLIKCERQTPPPQSHLLGCNEISDIAIRAFNEAIDADGYDTSYGCIEGAIRIALNRNTPHGRLNVETLSQDIVRAACELGDPADPDHEDTISIRVQDLEAVANRRITAAIEIASRPTTTEGSDNG